MACDGLTTAQQREHHFRGLLGRSRYESHVDNGGREGQAAPEDQFTEVAIESQQAAAFVVRCPEYVFISSARAALPNRRDVDARLTQDSYRCEGDVLIGQPDQPNFSNTT